MPMTKLTRRQQGEIEQTFLDAGALETYGLESKLARRYGVHQTTVHSYKEKLYGRRMFLSPRYHGFFGVTEDGRRFLVEREAWEQSVREGEEVAR